MRRSESKERFWLARSSPTSLARLETARRERSLIVSSLLADKNKRCLWATEDLSAGIREGCLVRAESELRPSYLTFGGGGRGLASSADDIIACLKHMGMALSFSPSLSEINVRVQGWRSCPRKRSVGGSGQQKDERS